MRLTGNLPGRPRFRFDATAGSVLAIGVVCLVFFFGAAGVSHAQSAADVQSIYETQCVACHTIGGGDHVGPDLAGVEDRQSREWLVEWIVNPTGMVGRGDPAALALLEEYNGVQMPNFGLTNGQAEALLDFIALRTANLADGAAPDPAPAPSPADTLVGDFNHGKELFTGSRRFANGGPACMSCHGVASMGALGGGAVGPELTEAASRYGGAAILATLLNDVPFPTMRPIFTGRPLMDQERADLAAFLEGVQAPQRSMDSLFVLLMYSTGGFIVLIILFQVIWRRRSQGVRASVVRGGRP